MAVQSALTRLLDKYGDDVADIDRKELYELAGISSSTFYDNFSGISSILRESERRIKKDYNACAESTRQFVGLSRKLHPTQPVSEQTQRQYLLDRLMQWHYRRENMILSELAVRRFSRDAWLAVLKPCMPFLLTNREQLAPENIARQNHAFTALYTDDLSEWRKEGFSDLKAEKYKSRIMEHISCVLLIGRNQ